ncbi:hypothetical protein L3X38_024062 [Prunus dulcis]|uniref:Uncharacterized protein n=1 Tax=Prunus dulcis TaxID=3755 RepID=A0AAD4VZ35_PRUDU|nr:hypothetical protein L3X38_024062 [Prunus dulcis]
MQNGGRKQGSSEKEEPVEDKVEEAVVKLRTLGSESGMFAQNFDVGLCASRCGDDTYPWRLGSAVWELRQVVAVSEECLPSVGKKACLP